MTQTPLQTARIARIHELLNTCLESFDFLPVPDELSQLVARFHESIRQVAAAPFAPDADTHLCEAQQAVTDALNILAALQETQTLGKREGGKPAPQLN